MDMLPVQSETFLQASYDLSKLGRMIFFPRCYYGERFASDERKLDFLLWS